MGDLMGILEEIAAEHREAVERSNQHHIERRASEAAQLAGEQRKQRVRTIAKATVAFKKVTGRAVFPARWKVEKVEKVKNGSRTYHCCELNFEGRLTFRYRRLPYGPAGYDGLFVRRADSDDDADFKECGTRERLGELLAIWGLA